MAPVTLDNSDYAFAAAYTKPAYRERVRAEYVPYMESIVAFFEERSVEVAGREFPQILLIHASEITRTSCPTCWRCSGAAAIRSSRWIRRWDDEAYRLDGADTWGAAGSPGFTAGRGRRGCRAAASRSRRRGWPRRPRSDSSVPAEATEANAFNTKTRSFEDDTKKMHHAGTPAVGRRRVEETR